MAAGFTIKIQVIVETKGLNFRKRQIEASLLISPATLNFVAWNVMLMAERPPAGAS